MKKIQYNGISKLLSGIVSKINNLIDIVEMKADWEQTDPTAFDYIKNKPDSLDEKVKQENTTSDEDYRVLLSKSANDITEIDKTWKNSDLKYNPFTANLTAVRLNGNEIGNDPQFTDTTYENKAAVQGGSEESLVTTGEKYTWNNKVDIEDLSDVATSGEYIDLNSRPSTSYYGTCTNNADVSAKTVTISSGQNFTLQVGAVVSVKFSNTNTASDVTLNVNNTGAKPIYYNNAVYTSTSATVCGTANRIITYVYDGTSWVWLSHGADNNTTYSVMGANVLYLGEETTGRLIRADRANTDINKLIDDKISALDDDGGTAQASETIASWSETDGKVSVTTQAIAIQKSQVIDFSHTHGNIQNGGTLQTTDVAIENGDKLVITDASNSNKIARTLRAFDGSTTTTALTPKGTFETFSKLELGETSTNAYYGNKGKTAYDHSQLTSGNPHSVTKSDVGLGNVPNVTTNNQKPTFTQASTRANLVSNTDTLSTIMGKIMKWFDDLKTVAFTGSYNDLSNTPTIPTVNNAKLTIQKNGANVKTFTANASSDVTANIVVPTALADLTEDSTHKFVSQAEKTTWNGKSDFSGSYNDLTDKPTIPTVNNATLTIQKNGTNVQTFTANASSNKTANITVPVALSELTDDATHRVVTDTQISSWDSKGTSNLTLGTSSTTAYRGDRGNTAYTHATDSSRLTTATASGLYKVGSTAQGHISELVAVEKADITALGIPASDTNTHRPIQLNGTQILGNNTTVLNLKNGSNVSMTNSSGTVTINSTDENVKQSPKTDDVYYRVLLSNSNSNSEETGPANKSAEVTVNPSTGRLRSKRFSVENNEAYSVYPINVNVTGREASTAGQDIKVLQVQYKTTNGTNTYNHTTYPISVIGNDASNTNNSGVRLGSVNGTTIVGAGECSDDFASAQSHYNDEKLYLVADDRVEMYVGLPNAATSYSAYMILGSGVGEGALEAGVLQFGTPDHFVRLKPPSNAAFSDVEFPTGGGLLITDNLVKWYSQGNYSGTGGKKLQPKTIEELQFVVHLPSSIDVTINITGIGITSSANATSNPGTYQSLRQGYYYATTAFGCVNIWVWVNTSNNYIYCQLKEVYQNNTTNIASSTSYDVYYR